jgi:sugar phosphate isomerase/epimerase
MIYASTGGFREDSGARTTARLLQAGIKSVELSGGSYSEDLLETLKAFEPDVSFQIHNYFPPPEHPFVLNLGSLDESIARKSIAHVEQALEWCQALGADRYSFHAGFLLDPKVDQLGRRIAHQGLFDRRESIAVFVDRVARLSKLAGQVGVKLMIENNVLSAKNAREFSQNPLLMCDPHECRDVMAMLPDNLGLLIDVAHLKVSANSLAFNPALMFEMCRERIVGHHLSDNDGLEDSNLPFKDDAWFWPYISNQIEYYSIEVYGCSPEVLLQQMNLVQSKIQA